MLLAVAIDGRVAPAERQHLHALVVRGGHRASALPRSAGSPRTRTAAAIVERRHSAPAVASPARMVTAAPAMIDTIDTTWPDTCPPFVSTQGPPTKAPEALLVPPGSQ